MKQLMSPRVRHRVIAASTLAIAVGGSGIAVAASTGTPEPARLSMDSGKVVDVEKPTYLQAPPETSVSAINNGTLRAAKTGEASSDLVGSARVASATNGVSVVIGRKASATASPSQVCMSFTTSAGGAINSGCSTLADVGSGILFVHDVLHETLAGVAPDGVKEVIVTDVQGDTRTVPVDNNAYVAKVVGQPARIEWASPEGARADLRIPAPAAGRIPAVPQP